jgi:hypothetical protein
MNSSARCHLNAEEEFENADYFKDPALIKKYQTRGVLHCWAKPDGTQKIEGTGPLGKKRMQTIDDEVTEATLDYLEKAKKADQPFFVWWKLHADARQHAPEARERRQDRARRLSRRNGRARRSCRADPR